MKLILGALIVLFAVVYGAFYYDNQRHLQIVLIEQKMQDAVHMMNQKMAFPRQVGALIRFEPWTIKHRIITMSITVTTKETQVPSDIKLMMKEQLMLMKCTMMNQATEKQIKAIEELEYYIRIQIYNYSESLLWEEKALLKHC